MAQLNQNFDATQVEPAVEYMPLPEGEYTALIEESEMKATKAGTGTYLSLTLQIVEGEYLGRKLFENLNLDNPNTQTVEIAQRTLSSICHATGQMSVSDSEQLHNIPMTIKVGFQKNDASRNAIKAYKALEGTAPAPQATPAQQAAPVAPQTTVAQPQQQKAPWGQ